MARRDYRGFTTTLLAALALAAVAATTPALANCDITSAANTVTCSASVSTTDTTNNDAATASSADRSQMFSTGGNVSGGIGAGVTVGGYGLAIETTENGAGLTFTNNGALNQATSIVGGSGSLQLTTSDGPITYNSATGATVSGVATSALLLFSRSASATGDITAHVNGDISNVGSYGAAVGVSLQSAATTGVNLLLDGTGNISGNTGIAASTGNTTSGTGNITVSGSGNITFTSGNGHGIVVGHGSDAGTVTINRTGTITGAGLGVGGGNIGIYIGSYGTGGVFVTGVGAISDVRLGIYGVGTDSFTFNPGGDITASNTGMFAQIQSGSGTANITSSHNVTATLGSGIGTFTVDGDATVNVTAGTISAVGAGVSVYGSGTGNGRVDMSGGTIRASSGSSVGIDVNEQGGGNATVNQTGGTIGTAGSPTSGTGIRAQTNSTGSIDITSTSVYSASTGVYASASGTGTVDVVNNGTVNSTNSAAVLTQAQGSATTIVNNGLLSGNFNNGVVYARSSGGTISITNAVGASIVGNQGVADAQMAIVTTGGATTLTNNGTLAGGLSLGGTTNAFVNTGTWTTDRASVFSGATTLTNSGTITIGSDGVLNGGNGLIINSTGMLRNNGVINGIVTVNGGTLGGNGLIVGTTTINNGGTLAPGNSIGTITINGNVTFNAGSIYAVEVSPTAADKTVATGTASLTGGTVQTTWQAGTYLSRSYTILTSAGLGGTTFAGLTNIGLPAGVTASLSYTATDVLLDIVATLGSLPGSGLTINEQNVANTLNNYFNNGGTLPPGFVTLYGLTGAALANGLDQVSGEVATGAATAGFQSMNQFLGAMTNPFGASPGGGAAGTGTARGFAPEASVTPRAASAYAAVTPRDARDARPAFGSRWGLWASAYGGSGRTGGDGAVFGSHDINARSYGVIAGADYRVTADTTVGFALGGGGTHWGLSNGLGDGRGDVFQIGAYALQRFGAAYFSGSLGYAWHSMSTDRTLTVSGTDKLNASFRAQSFGGRLESGYRFATSAVNVTPYAAVQAQAFRTPSYGESAVSGSNQFALNYDAKTTSTNRVELGAWFDRSYLLADNLALSLRARAAWAHDGNTDRTATAAFQSLTGTRFTVYGASGARNLALVSAGAEMALGRGWSAGGTFDGEFSGATTVYGGRATIKRVW